MTVDLHFVDAAFAKFNALCFDGSLPPIPVKLTRARTFLGKVTYVVRRGFFGRILRYENFCLRISSCFDLPENEWEDVVIHEMIHYYLAYNGIRDSSAHGAEFRRMMASINERYGRNVTVRHHGQNGLTSRKEEMRLNYLCVAQLKDGKWGICSCAKTRVLEMNRKLPKCYSLKSLEWYGSTDVFFNRYPHSIKPRIYKITREELDEHLAGAVSVVLKRQF